MLRWILAVLSFYLFLPKTHAAAPRPHTGELLYQLNTQRALPWALLRELGIKAPSEFVELLRPRQQGAAQLEKVRQKMLESGAFHFVEYNTIEHEASGAEELQAQWHHRNIASERAWEALQGQEDVLVAVCDSGVQVDHEDLQGRVLAGWSLIENAPDNTTTTSHGTFVGGLIGAHLNGLGGVGVAYGVKLLPLRISNNEGSTTMKRITDCIRMAADRGARVVNVSFTGIENQSVEAAGKYAREKGTLVVYSAGNHGKERTVEDYPDHAHILAVGATKSNDKRWTYCKNIFVCGGSNYGPFIDLMAPGHELFSTTVYDVLDPLAPKYRSGSGTSYAAPVVSAVAALVYAVHPDFTPSQVEDILKSSADKVGGANEFGEGRVNALRAVQLARERARR